ncbi:MAG: hypothetical protein WBB57_00210, partial [Mycobacterium sp.]
MVIPRTRWTAPGALLAVVATVALAAGCTSADDQAAAPSSAPLAMAAGPVPNNAPPPAAPVPA